jgi:hypothetical protein
MTGIVDYAMDGGYHSSLRYGQEHDGEDSEDKSVQVEKRHFFLRSLCKGDEP